MRLRAPMRFWRVPKAEPIAARGPLVLLYHSVSSSRPDPFGIRVSPRHFREHMAVLVEHARPMALAELDEAIQRGEAQPGAVAVTFDDGYADNLLDARPVLSRHGIPATIFIATGSIGSDDEYWWDELDRLLLRPGRLPARLRVRIGDRFEELELWAGARYRRVDGWGRRQWKVWHGAAPTRRHEVFGVLWEMLHVAPPQARDEALAQLRDWAGAARTGRPTHRSLTLEQLRELANDRLIEIGAHTVNHPSLGAIEPGEQQREIAGSKRWLEEKLDREVSSFSYPYGSPDDFTPVTVKLTRESGYERACTNVGQAIAPHVDRHQYPRRVVQDWDGRTFLGRLQQWFSETAAPLLVCAAEQASVFA